MSQHTTSGLSLAAPSFSTSSKRNISTPLFLALWLVAGRVSLMIMSLRRHRGALSSSKLHFVSSSQITTLISAVET